MANLGDDADAEEDGHAEVREAVPCGTVNGSHDAGWERAGSATLSNGDASELARFGAIKEKKHSLESGIALFNQCACPKPHPSYTGCMHIFSLLSGIATHPSFV